MKTVIVTRQYEDGYRVGILHRASSALIAAFCGRNGVRMTIPLPHPQKTLVSLADARAWSAADNLILRKYDGELTELNIGGAVIICEAMRGEISGHFFTAEDRAMFSRYPVWYAALTVESIGCDCALKMSTFWRWGLLQQYASQFPANVILPEIVTDVDAAMAGGAEGVCAMPWVAPWGNMLCHKQASIYVCRVTSTGSSQSVGICDAETGVDRGRLMLGGGACDRVRVGSIVRCEAMSEHEGGKLRQATKCREFLISY